ncbi:hypothetical protein CAE01nite_19530 [Cellulomonas aerilata]|uniref:Uncharacterized protein n=1 Tax=Cellulomonas aerilata TaxID=515326 RepID=A0A512DCM1_9CELL|nr:hypothetical protein CAE01nite_19530 [Cellulomonas aerilata]
MPAGPAVPHGPAATAVVTAAASRVLAQVRGALADAGPRHPYQRAMYVVAALLMASGVAHVGVWAVDGGAWEGAVSWRKPILFGVSFSLFALAVGWVQGVLPRSRAWGWTTTALIAGGGVAEVALITAQRWRGTASHFNLATPVDAVVFALMGVTIAVFGVGIVLLTVWAAWRLRRPAPTVLAVLVGLGLVLVASALGQDLITRGLAYVDAHDAVPPAVVFGVAGSGKLAHAVALHGIQVLGALALLLGRSGLTPVARTRAMLAASAGYVALTGLVVAQAYAGRSMLDVSAGLAAGLGLATLAVVVPFGYAVRDAVRGIRPAAPHGAVDGRR